MSTKSTLKVVTGPDRESNDPSLYLNREMSIIAFNHRVLQLAQDASLPLLERLRYLAIFSSNLDEFFEVRVAGLRERQQADLGSPYPDGSSPSALLRTIRALPLADRRAI